MLLRGLWNASRRRRGARRGDSERNRTRRSTAADAREEENAGFLRVSPTHTVYYEVYGNPKGKPVLFVHGGPGGGTTPAHARYFDPDAYAAAER